MEGLYKTLTVAVAFQSVEELEEGRFYLVSYTTELLLLNILPSWFLASSICLLTFPNLELATGFSKD